MERRLSNGNWIPVPEDQENIFLDQAVEDSARQNRYDATRYPLLSRSEIRSALSSGKEVRHGTDWYESLRNAPVRKPVPEIEKTLCQCGHRIAKMLVMNTSGGTSCPDCYDRMSE